jgi:hypothetical protein
MEKLGMDSAFPQIVEERTSDHADMPPTTQYSIGGISKRYLSAKDILCALLASNSNADEFMEIAYIEIVKKSYELADELLKQENQ